MTLLQVSGLFASWVSDCPLHLRSPNAPSKRDLLGTTASDWNALAQPAPEFEFAQRISW